MAGDDEAGKKPKKVLMVLEHMGAGGTETYALELANFLGDDAEVSFFCLSEHAETASHSTSNRVTVARKGLRGWFDLVKALRAARGGNAHLHLYTSLLRVVALCRLIGGLHVISTFHMPLRNWSLRHRIAWRGAASLSDVCVGVSSDCAASLGRYARGGAHVIPAALPVALIPRSNSARGSAHGVFTVAGSGRLSREKNWAALIEAVAIARRGSAMDLKLELFGDGPLRAALEKLADAHGVADAVRFHGFAPRDQMLRRLAEADLFVLPSNFEGLGLSAVEAMAIGLPTITSDFPASQDFIEDGVTGDRFARGNVDELARAILRHIDERQRSAKMAERGQAFVIDRFSADNTFGQYRFLYKP